MIEYKQIKPEDMIPYDKSGVDKMVNYMIWGKEESACIANNYKSTCEFLQMNGFKLKEQGSGYSEYYIDLINDAYLVIYLDESIVEIYIVSKMYEDNTRKYVPIGYDYFDTKEMTTKEKSRYGNKLK